MVVLEDLKLTNMMASAGGTPRRVDDRDVAALIDAVGSVDAHGPAYPPDPDGWAAAFYRQAMTA